MYRMATYKRRIVYLSDEEWEALRAQARGETTTISNLIRHGLALVPPSKASEQSTVEYHAPKGAAPLERFNSRPFTPVPKHRK